MIGLGVIGTTYGYLFQKAGHRVEHLIRDSKKSTTPNTLEIELLDGRFDNQGEEKTDSYPVNIAGNGGSYDFILVSVPAGNLGDAIKALAENNFKGTLLLMNGIWEDRRWLNRVLNGWGLYFIRIMKRSKSSLTFYNGNARPPMREYFMETMRIGFSKWRKDDIGLANSVWGDKEVTRFICAAGKFTVQEILQRLNLEIQNGKNYGVQYWPIFSLKNGDFIGYCGLHPYNPEEDAYEIGFHLREKYWGKGLATEGAKAVMDYAIDVLNANSLFAGHHPNNNGSKKVLKKLGFHYIGDKYYAPTGLFHPSYRYRRFRND